MNADSGPAFIETDAIQFHAGDFPAPMSGNTEMKEISCLLLYKRKQSWG